MTQTTDDGDVLRRSSLGRPILVGLRWPAWCVTQL